MKNYLYCIWEPMRSKKQIRELLAKITAISNVERQLGNIEHAQLMTAVGVGLRWVIYDFDFGLEDLTIPDIPFAKVNEEK
ncbi:MAG: hypothetical protein C3F06_02380 [Candidatus Methanoperedenaceae archaeon]|nr:MAG: hypothetical protein C3F06_02380 [Candidatus Methanoperedenaceae archaeon]